MPTCRFCPLEIRMGDPSRVGTIFLMKKAVPFAFFAALLALSNASPALAQTACPVGTAPGSATCGPGSGGYQEPPPRTPAGEWSSRFGAVASDPTGTGNTGVAEKKESREEAERAAIASCNGLGGGKCEVNMWYSNQCAAIASPYRNGIPAKGYPTSRSGNTVPLASENAKNACFKFNTEKPDECRIIYSGCSSAVFHRY